MGTDSSREFPDAFRKSSRNAFHSMTDYLIYGFAGIALLVGLAFVVIGARKWTEARKEIEESEASFFEEVGQELDAIEESDGPVRILSEREHGPESLESDSPPLPIEALDAADTPPPGEGPVDVGNQSKLGTQDAADSLSDASSAEACISNEDATITFAPSGLL